MSWNHLSSLRCTVNQAGSKSTHLSLLFITRGAVAWCTLNKYYADFSPTSLKTLSDSADRLLVWEPKLTKPVCLSCCGAVSLSASPSYPDREWLPSWNMCGLY